MVSDDVRLSGAGVSCANTPIASEPGIPRVWIFQPQVVHYRVPVWDLLCECAEDAYELTVLGPLENGRAIGGASRSYLRAFPHESFRRFGLLLARWPGAAELVRRERPEVVIITASPRSTTAWSLPGVCRQVGSAIIGWSKVHSYSSIPAPILRRVKRRFFSRFDRMLCYGDQSLAELIAHGYPPQRARVAANTIDTRRIFEDADAIMARGRALREKAGLIGRTVVLCLGRMDPVKRHSDLLKAWPKLRAYDPKLVLVLVGGGPLLDHVRAGARAVDPDRIIVTGRVPDGDDYAWIAAADLFLVPGGVGLAVNQALAFGRPTVIADESGADSEIVEHGVTGWRYPRGSIDALVDTVCKVLADPEATERVTAHARARLRDHITIGNMVAAMDATIREGLDISRCRRERP